MCGRAGVRACVRARAQKKLPKKIFYHFFFSKKKKKKKNFLEKKKFSKNFFFGIPSNILNLNIFPIFFLPVRKAQAPSKLSIRFLIFGHFQCFWGVESYHAA